MIRREIKIISKSSEVDNFIINIKKNVPFKFHKQHETRKVNNIYFDTQNYNNLNNHIEGVQNRYKTRFRWYGNFKKILKGNFELKNKNDLVGYKKIFNFEKIDLDENFLWDDFRIMLSKNSSVNKILKKYDLPALINSYKRKYYIIKSNSIRLTIDYNLKYFIQSSLIKPNFDNGFKEKNYSIIEIKFDINEYFAVKKILSLSKARLRKFSKYVYGFSYKYFN
jgi:hypothetical protein